MARVKQEVIEQRAQKQRTTHHHPSLSSAMSPSTGVSPPSAPPKPPRTKANVFSSGCIDLTLDDDTEDEEEKDEPLGQFVPPPHTTPVDLAAEEENQGAREKAEAAAEEKEQPPVQEVEKAAQNEDEDTDTDVEEMPMEVEAEATAASVEPKPTPSFQRFSMSDVESDEDDELPVRPTITEDEEEKKEEDEEDTETHDKRQPPVVTGLRSIVKKVGSAIGYMFGSQREDEGEEEVVEIVDAEKTRQDEEDEIEEEEDEALPVVYEPPATETTGVPGSAASDSGSAMDIDDDGDQPVPREASAGSVRAVPVTGASLEDGEIFEEGAVVKSPSEVKQAIEQELLAAKGAKKRPKKRGRKKNKRKAEVLVPVETVDEFGRVVRPRVEGAASSPAGQEPQWTSPPKPSFPSAPPSSSSSSPNGSASPSPPALLQTPPRPTMMMPPPLPRMPPPPQNNFPVPRGNMPLYPDEHIVRVNRHGGVEPFSIYHGSHGLHGVARPPLPMFPPMPLPPPPPVNGGFRYVPVTGFQPPPGPDAPRSFKRPLPPFMQDDNEEDDAGMMDLDSLRAAALRTKRKTSEKETQESVQEDANPVAPPSQSPPVDESMQTEAEEDPSLDALRAQLLKSMRPRKRLASNSRAASASSTTPPQVTADPTNNSAETSKPTTPSSQHKSVVATLAASEAATPLPESPMFRPLTAASQSIVIRFSLDDLKAKDRSDSFDDENAIAKYSRVVDEVRAKVASSDLQPKVLKENGVAKKTSPAKKSLLSPTRGRNSSSSSRQKKFQKPLIPTKTESPVKATIEKCEEKKEAPEAAEPPASSPTNEESSPVDVQAIAVPLTTAKPAVDEREMCLASIREADAQLARLDAEIAALRRVLVAKEHAAASAAASPPSRPVPVEI